MQINENLKRIERNVRAIGVIQTGKKILIHILHRKLAPHFEPDIQKRELTRGEIIDICEMSNNFIDVYDSENIYEFNIPVGLERECVSELEFRNRHPKYVRTEPPLVCEINNVTVVSSYAVPISPFGILPEKGLSSKNILIGLVSSLMHGVTPDGTSLIRSKTHLDTAIFLIGPHDKNYYHWFNNYLPRLEGLHHYPKAEEVTIVIPKNAAQWHLDSLRLLGFTNYNIIEWTGRPTDVDTYILNQYRTESQETKRNRSVVKSKNNYQWIADQFHKNINLNDDSKNRRIYISRNDATTRRTINEEEVMSTLSEYDFEKYNLSDLDLEEQFKIFYQADVIIGAHGAGLTNMMFCNNVSVIELLGPKSSAANPGVFYNMAQVFGHTYACIDVETHDRDIYVNTDLLVQVLENL